MFERKLTCLLSCCWMGLGRVNLGSITRGSIRRGSRMICSGMGCRGVWTGPGWGNMGPGGGRCSDWDRWRFNMSLMLRGKFCACAKSSGLISISTPLKKIFIYIGEYLNLTTMNLNIRFSCVVYKFWVADFVYFAAWSLVQM